MPSGGPDDPRFTTVDWDTVSGRWRRPRLRTIALVLALGLLATMYVYDSVVAPEELIAQLHWDVTRMDWLALVALVFFGRYVLVPLAADRRRTAGRVREFCSRPAAVISLLILLFFAVVAIVGPELLDRGYPTLAHRLQPPAFSRVRVDDLAIIYECVGERSGNSCLGTWTYPLGTTYIGEDVMLLLARGVRVALSLGLVVALLMSVVATAVGTTAGYVGGWVDDVLMSYVDIQQTVPGVIVYVLLASLVLGDISGVTQGGLFALAVVFGLLDWGGIARLVRSEVMARRSAGYVSAAKAAGASDLQVIRRHIIPNSTGTIVTSLTRRIPLVILAQTGLAYLELHRAGSKSLGRLLNIGLDGRHMAWHRKWWVSTFAVIVLILIVVGFSVVGDEVRDIVDPEAEVE